MTPQRTLHGKRHIRARATVRIGRERRKVKRIEREIKALRRAIAYMVGGKMADDISKAVLEAQRGILLVAKIVGGIMADSAAAIGNALLELNKTPKQRNNHG